jgi:hypothetical protein
MVAASLSPSIEGYFARLGENVETGNRGAGTPRWTSNLAKTGSGVMAGSGSVTLTSRKATDDVRLRHNAGANLSSGPSPGTPNESELGLRSNR